MTAAVRPRDEVEAAVCAALDTVLDPELDESLASLGFVQVEVGSVGDVRVGLRLPTYWCAANFAYLMADDVREAVGAVPGVTSVEVRLGDHFAAEEVTAGVRAVRSFDEAFAELADGGGLEPLRRLFLGKAFTMRQERLLRALLRRGHSFEQLAGMRLGDVPEVEELTAYLERRRRLGLPFDPDSHLALMPGGRPLGAEELASWIHRARATRVSLESNASLCQALLRSRYEKTAEVSR